MIKFLIVGRTGSGKSLLEQNLMMEFEFTSLKSYSTRAPRGIMDYDHIYVDIDEMEKLKSKIIAHTEINGIHYFATLDQLLVNDIYLIDPNGIKILLEKTKNENIQYVIIYLRIDKSTRRWRTEKRANYNFDERDAAENANFSNFEQNGINIFDKQFHDKILGVHFIDSNPDMMENTRKIIKIYNKDN